MRIECLHGYFKFTETAAGQISNFIALTGLELELSGDHFTFSDLVDAPNYSIAGGTFLGAPTIETFEGPPWEVMRVNKLVYDFTRGLVLPIALIIQSAPVTAVGNYFASTGMILPGSVMDDGSRVTDYAAFCVNSTDRFKYTTLESADV